MLCWVLLDGVILMGLVSFGFGGCLVLVWVTCVLFDCLFVIAIVWFAVVYVVGCLACDLCVVCG